MKAVSRTRIPPMSRWIPAFAVVLGWASAALAATPAPLTSLRAVHALTNEQATHALPVVLEATVTYYRPSEKTLFVEDGDFAIYVQPTTTVQMVPGDRILIRGTTVPSFRPFIKTSDVTLLSHGALPKPAQATFEQLMRAELDCRLVTVHGIVQSADLELSSMMRNTSLRILSNGGYIDASIDSTNPNTLSDFLDAEVEITGAASGRFDGKMQQTGILIHAASLAAVRVLSRAKASPWTFPITPMDEILTGYRMQDLSQRVRVHGIITYFQPGSAVVLQSGSKSLWIETQTISPLRIGDEADATGFPDLHDGFLTLTNGEVQPAGPFAPVTPQAVTWHELTNSKHGFDLVSIDGKVVTAIRKAAQDEYVLVADGYMFSAIYRHSNIAGFPDPPLAQIPVGSTVRVTGICSLDSSKPFEREVPFNILLRSSNDIAVVARPPLINVRNLLLMVGFLLVVVFAIGARGWTLDRQLRRQTAALSARIEADAALDHRLAQIEQRRSRILEDINGSRPLAEILEQVVELTSFRLDGAPCWCEVTEGARLGAHPLAVESMRVVREAIPGRAGPPLGNMFAAFNAGTESSAGEEDALSFGARLATLAIETRRLYSDLLHRSEFDLLTDIHNRFSLDKRLEAQIEVARLNAAIFGLIYIDLDEFKQVNDVYGHQVGDLYLQEVSLRMKRQLRSNDLLARLGGDEFAALVSVVPSRAGVEEIAQRLERCFDEPFAVEGYVLRGSASVGIALYPEDGASKDSLLSAADAAMYVAKHTKHPGSTGLADRHGDEVTQKRRS